MKKVISYLCFSTIYLLISSNLFAVTVVDDFNRSSLGSNWTADPEYQIAGNIELDNTSTVANWNALAVYNAISNPLEVSFKWSTSANTEGVNSGGFSVRLSSASVNATGYFIFRRYSTIYLHPILSGVVMRETTIDMKTATQNALQAGDVIKLVMSSDGSGHHFDFYVNGVFDGRVTDAAKTYGNATTWYTGVSLFGNSTNNIDNYTLSYPSVTVTSPNGGEDWTVNSNHNITWTSDTFTGNVKIEYSANGGGSWNTIIASTANTGSYPWTVPNNPSLSYLVRISDAADGNPSDISNAYFTVSPEVEAITVLTPNGGENWTIGSEHAITWNGSGSIANVKIEYSTNNGTTWTTETSSTSNDGSYTWTVPQAPSSTCLVKISDKIDGIPFDQSNAVFTISAEVQLQVNNSSGEPGSTGNTVYVSMNNQVNVRGVQFTLTDTPDLLTATGVTATTRAPGFSASFNETGTDVEVLLISFTGGEINTGTGPILQITYDVDGAAVFGDKTTMSISNAKISNVNRQNIFANLVDGEFLFSTPGDMDSDGDVDGDDIDRFVEIVMGTGADPSAYEYLAGDFDKDGIIDIYDLLTAYDLQ